MGVLGELLRPRTDDGALVQLLVVVALLPAGLWWARHDGERRWLVVGLTVFVLSWFAFRTLH